MRHRLHRLRHAAAAFAIAATLFACDDGLQASKSNDINIDTEVLVFTRQPTGSLGEQRKVRVRQGGEALLTISKIYIQGAEDCDRITQGLGPFDPFPGDLETRCEFIIDERPDPLPETLGEDEFFFVAIRYRPRNIEPPPDATLVIESDVRDKEIQNVRLSVQGATPRISASERIVSFAGAAMGQDATVLIHNRGSGPLTVQPFRIELQTEEAIDENGVAVSEFTVTPDSPMPWTIDESDARVVTIQYEPFDDKEDRALLIFPSDDPENRELSIELTSQAVFSVISVTPNPLVFEAGRVGEVSQPIQIGNSGLGMLEVLSMEIEQNAMDFSIAGQTSFVLGGGSEPYTGVSIKYNPQTADGSNGTLVIRSNANNAPDGYTRVTLLGSTSVPPAVLQIEPAASDMSDVEPGGSRAEAFTLTNVGGSDLEISSIALSDGSDPGIPASDDVFSITSGGGSTSIPPDGTHEVEVTFDRAGDDRSQRLAVLVIESNADTSPNQIFITANAPAIPSP